MRKKIMNNKSENSNQNEDTHLTDDYQMSTESATHQPDYWPRLEAQAKMGIEL